MTRDLKQVSQFQYFSVTVVDEGSKPEVLSGIAQAAHSVS